MQITAKNSSIWSGREFRHGNRQTFAERKKHYADVMRALEEKASKFTLGWRR
jgi:hypothetical protein